MVFYGKGGYDWNTIFNMPIWLRRFVFSKIMEHYESEKSQSNTNSVKKSVDAMKSAGFTKEQLENRKSNRTPSYVTKASKK
jgi:hypothetical protein